MILLEEALVALMTYGKFLMQGFAVANQLEELYYLLAALIGVAQSPGSVGAQFDINELHEKLVGRAAISASDAP